MPRERAQSAECGGRFEVVAIASGESDDMVAIDAAARRYVASLHHKIRRPPRETTSPRGRTCRKLDMEPCERSPAGAEPAIDTDHGLNSAGATSARSRHTGAAIPHRNHSATPMRGHTRGRPSHRAQPRPGGGSRSYSGTCGSDVCQGTCCDMGACRLCNAPPGTYASPDI